MDYYDVFFIMYNLETKTNQSRWKYLDSGMTKLLNFCCLQIPSNLASRKSSIGKLTSSYTNYSLQKKKTYFF